MRIVKVKFGQRQLFEAIPGFVYVGRRFGGFEASPLANRWKPGRDGTVEEVLSDYRRWLRWRIELGDLLVNGLLDALTPDSVLGCWCVDKARSGDGGIDCHAEIIAEKWARREVAKLKAMEEKR